MQPLELSDEGRKLSQALESVVKEDSSKPLETIHISGVGGRLYFAYEQLRNAAEYGERHLLIRRAIERFLRRNIRFGHFPEPLGIDLIAELTHARYLQNDSISRTASSDIDSIIERYVKLTQAIQQSHKVSKERLANWVYQSASVEIEQQLVPHRLTDAFIDFAYQHYLDRVDASSFEVDDDKLYKIALYISVHRTLFKSDIATIRYYAMASRLGVGGEHSLTYFVELNAQVDRLFQSSLTNRLGRLINRFGAPIRILRELSMKNPDPESLFRSQSELMSKVEYECQLQYRETRKKLNDGIVRSVLFIFTTKVILGVSIEVPYDLVTSGEVDWVPLTINTLFPPAYMATIGWGIRTPGRRNTEVIQSYIRRILYQTDDPPIKYRIKRRVSSSSLIKVFNFIYAIAFAISFGLLVYVLKSIGFNVVNGIIFFVFLSVVSFFGFRLIQTAREFEIVDQRKSLLSVALDFFYTPFIRVGHWLSDKYSRLNVVTLIMDMAIELPLKTSLRVVQQWVGFIRDKQEDL